MPDLQASKFGRPGVGFIDSHYVALVNQATENFQEKNRIAIKQLAIV